MSSFKSKPKKQTNYPKLLNEFEKKRHQHWPELKQKIQENPLVKAMDSRRLQMVSGKRGK